MYRLIEEILSFVECEGVHFLNRTSAYRQMKACEGECLPWWSLVDCLLLPPSVATMAT